MPVSIPRLKVAIRHAEALRTVIQQQLKDAAAGEEDTALAAIDLDAEGIVSDLQQLIGSIEAAR